MRPPETRSRAAARWAWTPRDPWTSRGPLHGSWALDFRLLAAILLAILRRYGASYRTSHVILHTRKTLSKNAQSGTLRALDATRIFRHPPRGPHPDRVSSQGARSGARQDAAAAVRHPTGARPEQGEEQEAPRREQVLRGEDRRARGGADAGQRAAGRARPAARDHGAGAGRAARGEAEAREGAAGLPGPLRQAQGDGRCGHDRGRVPQGPDDGEAQQRDPVRLGQDPPARRGPRRRRSARPRAQDRRRPRISRRRPHRQRPRSRRPCSRATGS